MEKMMVPTSFELGSFISFIISFITNDIRKFYLASTWENCTRRRLYVKVSFKNLLLGKNLLPIYTTEAKSFFKKSDRFQCSVLRVSTTHDDDDRNISKYFFDRNHNGCQLFLAQIQFFNFS